MISSRNKYGAKKTLGSSGRMYDSRAERDRGEQLRLLQIAGEISDLREQTRVELEPGIFYRSDFDYIEKGRRVFEDVKGVMTERFRLICSIWKIHGPAPLRIVKRAKYGGSFCITKTVYPESYQAEGPTKSEQ